MTGYGGITSKQLSNDCGFALATAQPTVLPIRPAIQRKHVREAIRAAASQWANVQARGEVGREWQAGFTGAEKEGDGDTEGSRSHRQRRPVAQGEHYARSTMSRGVCGGYLRHTACASLAELVSCVCGEVVGAVYCVGGEE